MSEEMYVSNLYIVTIDEPCGFKMVRQALNHQGKWVVHLFEDVWETLKSVPKEVKDTACRVAYTMDAYGYADIRYTAVEGDPTLG